MEYNFRSIEERWRIYWAKNHTFKAENNSSLPKYYILDMFPYPSGAGLHVGHPLGYIASDIFARYKRHKAHNVLHPQGYDSFGLPAEQYAIQTGKHPAITTKENINTYREQLDKMGFSFDWSRELRTSDPNFYRWTQCIFIDLFEHYYCKKESKAKKIVDLISFFEESGNENINAFCDDNIPIFKATEWQKFSAKKKSDIVLKYRLAYLSYREVNWCPGLGTVLANDEIINNARDIPVSERGGFPVVKKKMKQWSIRIGAYAERLLTGLETIDWSDSLKEIQRNWIGKSVGVEIDFLIKGFEEKITVFTTRPDTIFGVTFLTLAPELDIVLKITSPEQREEVKNYIEKTKAQSDIMRQKDANNSTGVFTGAYALHPFTEVLLPIWISNYVLAGYGTGAIMAVPCGDSRDFKFAKQFKLSIKNIFEGVDISEESFSDKEKTIFKDSDFLDGLTYKAAFEKIISKIEEKRIGKKRINYRLKDAVFSRQRYWGEPIPIYFKKGLPTPLPKEKLPLQLPQVEKYLPLDEKTPPLGNATDWAWDEKNQKVVANEKINERTIFPLELTTMPGWAGSSWYFNRYMDATNDEDFVGQDAVNYWQKVDLYIGGIEHATGHLLYSRFWQKFLFDLGKVPVEEYAQKLINQGMILGNSAYIHMWNNKYYSADIPEEEIKKYKKKGALYTIKRVDTNCIKGENELDIDKLKEHYPEYKSAKFVKYEGKFTVSRDIEKMSKSKLNVINPDDICEQYGADTLRMYEMFLGPLEQTKPWKTSGITGVHSFLKKLWRLFYQNDTFFTSKEQPTLEMLKTLHKTIKKVTEDIESFSFNTCVSAFMICVNELTLLKCNNKEILSDLVILISPFAPHLAEELWEKLGNETSISKVPYPEFDEKYLKEVSKNYPISFNGKVRFTLDLPLDMKKETIEKTILDDIRTQKQLQGKSPKKIIVVPKKIINIVV